MTDDLYKRMVLALPPEFFDGWQWQSGDKAISNNIIYTVVGGNEKGALLINEKMQLYSTHNLNFGPLVTNCRPLPSQKRLQDMCLDEGEEFDPELLYTFYTWVYSPLRKVVFDSMESAWLQYVMWVLYRKEWDGEQWV